MLAMLTMENSILVFKLRDAAPFPADLSASAVAESCAKEVGLIELLPEEGACVGDGNEWRFNARCYPTTLKSLLSLPNIIVNGREVFIHQERVDGVRIWCSRVAGVPFPRDFNMDEFVENLNSSILDEGFENVNPISPGEFSPEKWEFVTDDITAAFLLQIPEVCVNNVFTVRFTADTRPEGPQGFHMTCNLVPRGMFPVDMDVPAFLKDLDGALMDDNISADVAPVSCEPGQCEWIVSVAEEDVSVLLGAGDITVDEDCTVRFGMLGDAIPELPTKDKVYYKAENLPAGTEPGKLIDTCWRKHKLALEHVPKESVVTGTTTRWCFQIEAAERGVKPFPDSLKSGVLFVKVSEVLVEGDQLPIHNLPVPPVGIIPPIPPDFDLERTRVQDLEVEHFKLLAYRERFASNLDKAQDPRFNFAEYWIRALASYFEYEARRFINPNMRLNDSTNGRPLVFTDASSSLPVDCTDDFSCTLATVSLVEVIFVRIRECLQAERLEVVLGGHVDELYQMWTILLAFTRAEQTEFMKTRRTLSESVDDSVGAGVDSRVRSLIALLSAPVVDGASFHPIFLEIWPILRSLAFDSKNQQLSYCICELYRQWNRCCTKDKDNATTNNLAAIFEKLRDKCVNQVLRQVQVIDFDEMFRLDDKYIKTNTHPYAGKAVVALMGPTGSGKSSMVHALHGADFKEVYPGKNVHLIPQYSDADADIARSVDLFKTGSGEESESIQVNAVVVPGRFTGGEDVVLLDLPGFDETRSTELAIINGLNISRSLHVCTSVRVLVVLSMQSLCDRLSDDAALAKLSSVISVLKDPADVRHFNYVFTKGPCEAASSVSNSFVAVQGCDKVHGNLMTLCQDIVTKTTPTAVVVNARSAKKDRLGRSRNSDILPGVMSNAGVITNPDQRFGHCVTEGNLLTLSMQLELVERGVHTALERNNSAYVSAKLDMLLALVSRFPELNAIADSNTRCVTMVQSTVEKAFMQVKYDCENIDLDRLGEYALQSMGVNLLKLLEFSGLWCLKQGGQGDFPSESCALAQALCARMLGAARGRAAAGAAGGGHGFDLAAMGVWATHVRQMQGLVQMLMPQSEAMSVLRSSVSEVCKGKGSARVSVVCLWRATNAPMVAMMQLLMNLIGCESFSEDISVCSVDLATTESTRFDFQKFSQEPCCIVVDDTGETHMVGLPPSLDRQSLLISLRDCLIKVGVSVGNECEAIIKVDDSDISVDDVVADVLHFLTQSEELLRGVSARLAGSLDMAHRDSASAETGLKRLAECSCVVEQFFKTFAPVFENINELNFVSTAREHLTARVGGLLEGFKDTLAKCASRETEDIDKIRLCVLALAAVRENARFPPGVNWNMIQGQFARNFYVVIELQDAIKLLRAFVSSTSEKILSGTIDFADPASRRAARYDFDIMRELLEVFRKLAGGGGDNEFDQEVSRFPPLTRGRKKHNKGEDEDAPLVLFNKALHLWSTHYKSVRDALLAAAMSLSLGDHDSPPALTADGYIALAAQLGDTNAVAIHHTFHNDVGDAALNSLRRLRVRTKSAGCDITSLARAQWASSCLLTIVKLTYFKAEDAHIISHANSEHEGIMGNFNVSFDKLIDLKEHYLSLQCDSATIKCYWEAQQDYSVNPFAHTEQQNQALLAKFGRISCYLPSNFEKLSIAEKPSDTGAEAEVRSQELLQSRLDGISAAIQDHFGAISKQLPVLYMELMSDNSTVESFKNIRISKFDEMVDAIFHLVDYLDFYIPKIAVDVTASANEESSVRVSVSDASKAAMGIKAWVLSSVLRLYDMLTALDLPSLGIQALEHLARMSEVLANIDSSIKVIDPSPFKTLAETIYTAISVKMGSLKSVYLKTNDFYNANALIADLKANNKDGWQEDKLESLMNRIESLADSLSIENPSHFWRTVSALNNAVLFCEDILDDGKDRDRKFASFIAYISAKINKTRQEIVKGLADCLPRKVATMHRLMSRLRVLMDSFDTHSCAACVSACVSDGSLKSKSAICHNCCTPLPVLAPSLSADRRLVVCSNCSVKQLLQSAAAATPTGLTNVFTVELQFYQFVVDTYEHLFELMRDSLVGIGSRFGSRPAQNAVDAEYDDSDYDSDDCTGNNIGSSVDCRFGYTKDFFKDVVELQSLSPLSNCSGTESLDFNILVGKVFSEVNLKFEEIVSHLGLINRIYDEKLEKIFISSISSDVPTLPTLAVLGQDRETCNGWIKLVRSGIRNHFFISKASFVEYKQHRASIAKALLLSAMVQGDNQISSLLAKQHHCGRRPETTEQIKILFIRFCATVGGGDVKVALHEAIACAGEWKMHALGEVLELMIALVERVGALITPLRSLQASASVNNILIVNQNLDVIVRFLTGGSALSAVFHSDDESRITDADKLLLARGKETLMRTLDKSRDAVISAINTVSFDADSLLSLLAEIEQLLPTAPSSPIPKGIGINVKEFNDLWIGFTCYEGFIRFLAEGKLDFLNIMELGKGSVKDLFAVPDRIAHITASASSYLMALPFDHTNANITTQNRVDKEAFYNFLQFCQSLCGLGGANSAQADFYWKEKMRPVIVDFADVCSAELTGFQGICSTYVRNDAEEIPKSEVFAKFGEFGFQNLLVISEVFVGVLQSVAREKLGAIKIEFKVEIDKLLRHAHLNDEEWRLWDDGHVHKVAKILIIVKQIELSIFWRKDLSEVISNDTQEFLNSCLRRGDQGPRFISKLYSKLKSISSDGYGSKVLDFSIFQHFATAHRNTQFKRVSVHDIVQDAVSRSSGGCGTPEYVEEQYRRYFDDNHSIPDTYWKIVEECLPMDKRYLIPELPLKAIRIAADIKTSSSKAAVIDGIWKLICYSFACWTLSEQSLKSYDRTPNDEKKNNHLTQPHPGQVVVVMRLLGLDTPEVMFETPAANTNESMFEWLVRGVSKPDPAKLQFVNHLAEVKTGEGKSVVLAVTAAVLALIGFDCDIVCYSQELSRRDESAFAFLFKAFKINDHIRYDTFKKLSKFVLDSRGSVASRMEDVILGRAPPAIAAGSASPRHSILLVDEVDVLFSSNFYGKSFDILAQLKGESIPEIAGIIRKVYEYKEHSTEDLITAWTEISASVEYESLVAVFDKDWTFLITNAVQKMLLDLSTLPTHKCHIITSEGVGYFDSDNTVVFNQRKGYHTMFELMKAHSRDRSCVSDTTVMKMQNILVQVGALSYAELPKRYKHILGVTGTLDCVTSAELSEYDIKRKSYMRSAYPAYSYDSAAANNATVKKVPFNGVFGEDVIRPTNTQSHFDNICDQIDKEVKGGKRPILVFFKDESALIAFAEHQRFAAAYGTSAKKMVPGCTDQDKLSLIQNATCPGRVTLLVAIYGRGTDFQYDDSDLDKIGGIHVIITFFPQEKSEQIQLQGRTARQGHPGSVSMVLDVNDFEVGGVNFNDLEQMLYNRTVNVLALMCGNRDKTSAERFEVRKGLAAAKREEHLISRDVLCHLFETSHRSRAKLIEKIKDRNMVTQTLSGILSRTMILIDGTHSMNTPMTHVRTKIKEILQRTQAIVQDNCGFAVQIVVYRNYNCSPPENVLECSNWERDPLQLEQFVSDIRLDGGIGGEEAMEMAFKHACNEIKCGRAPTQIVLIGDQGPMSRGQIDQIRGAKSGNQKVGEALWRSLTDSIYHEPCYWKEELAEICNAKVTLHAFYLPWYNGKFPARQAFKKIHDVMKDHGGQYGELKVLDDDGAQRLTDVICVKILKDIDMALQRQGRSSDFTNDYGAKYHANLQEIDGYVE
jgi:hypothetical protein